MTSFNATAFGALVDQERAALEESGRGMGNQAVPSCDIVDLTGALTTISAVTQENATRLVEIHERVCPRPPGECPASRDLNRPSVVIQTEEEIVPGVAVDVVRTWTPDEAFGAAAAIVAAALEAQGT